MKVTILIFPGQAGTHSAVCQHATHTRHSRRQTGHMLTTRLAGAAAEHQKRGLLAAVLVEAAAEDCPKAPNAGADWLDAAAD